LRAIAIIAGEYSLWQRAKVNPESSLRRTNSVAAFFIMLKYKTYYMGKRSAPQ
jgi:hypothetical protein